MSSSAERRARRAQPDRFIGDLIIRVIPHWEIEVDGAPQQWEVMEPFAFVSSFGRVTVPRGFITDFGSVPSAAKPIVDDDDPDLIYGALPHDWLYRTQGRLCTSIMPPAALTRYQADCVLREAMLAAGAPPFKAWLVFNAVRIGGGRPWKASQPPTNRPPR